MGASKSLPSHVPLLDPDSQPRRPLFCDKYAKRRCDRHCGSAIYGTSTHIPADQDLLAEYKEKYPDITYNQVFAALVVKHLKGITDIAEQRKHAEVILELIPYYTNLTIEVRCKFVSSWVSVTSEEKQAIITKYFEEHPWLTTIFRRSLTEHYYECCELFFLNVIFLTKYEERELTSHIRKNYMKS